MVSGRPEFWNPKKEHGNTVEMKAMARSLRTWQCLTKDFDISMSSTEFSEGF